MTASGKTVLIRDAAEDERYKAAVMAHAAVIAAEEARQLETLPETPIVSRKERRAAFRKENGCSQRVWAYRWSQDL